MITTVIKCLDIANAHLCFGELYYRPQFWHHLVPDMDEGNFTCREAKEIHRVRIRASKSNRDRYCTAAGVCILTRRWHVLSICSARHLYWQTAHPEVGLYRKVTRSGADENINWEAIHRVVYGITWKFPNADTQMLAAITHQENFTWTARDEAQSDSRIWSSVKTTPK